MRVLLNYILLINTGVICVCLVAYIWYVADDNCLQSVNLNSEDIVSGDLIFTEGHSFKSDIVRLGNRDENRYSHVGILLREVDSISVVHMSIDLDCIVKEGIESFVKNNNVVSFDVCKMDMDVSEPKLKSLIDSMLSQKIEFDMDFDHIDRTKLYCTEMVCDVYEKLCDTIFFPDIKTSTIIYPGDLYDKIRLITK